MSSKEIESLLLSGQKGAQDKLEALLEASDKMFLQEVFNILFNKIVSGPLDEAETILTSIELIALNNKPKDYKIWISSVKKIIHRLSSLNVNDDISLKNIKYHLLDIIRKLNDNKNKYKNENLYSVYYRMLFCDKNIETISLILREEKNILGRKDSRGNDLFYNILDHYRHLEEVNEEEISYFYDVIILFMKYQENNIIRQKDTYISLLLEEPYHLKQHVQNIYHLFQGLDNIPIMKLKKKYDIRTKWQSEHLSEIAHFKWDSIGRTIIDAPFITIDDEDAVCLDDALALIPNEDGSYTFYIAITDIPALVPYQSLTFYEAMRKCETLYLCDDVISLYPETLANDLCSLVQGKQRPAIVYQFIVDPYFNIDIDSLKIIKGIITVQKRLSYDDVNKGKNVTPQEYKWLENMYFMAMKLRRNHGAHREDYRQLENLISADATYHHSLFASRSLSANIVEESMLLVNSGAASYFNKRGLIYAYRNYLVSSEKGIKSAIDKLLHIDSQDTTSAVYKGLIAQIRSLYLNASYSTINRGHEGLGYSAYSHSTSAARRFCDSFNQYLTYFQVFNKITNDKDYYELEQMAREVVTHINSRKKENSLFESEYNYLRIRAKLLERKK